MVKDVLFMVKCPLFVDKDVFYLWIKMKACQSEINNLNPIMIYLNVDHVAWQQCDSGHSILVD